jgi:hypothetical protein
MTASPTAAPFKNGDQVRYTFDGRTGTVCRLVTKFRQTYAVVLFPGKTPREVPVKGLEPVR